jgi:hypothetical protein
MVKEKKLVLTLPRGGTLPVEVGLPEENTHFKLGTSALTQESGQKKKNIKSAMAEDEKEEAVGKAR